MVLNCRSLRCSVPTAKDVIKEIEDFDGLEALRLEGNTVGVEAAKVIAKALEKKSELKVRIQAEESVPDGDKSPLTVPQLLPRSRAW